METEQYKKTWKTFYLDLELKFQGSTGGFRDKAVRSLCSYFCVDPNSIRNKPLTTEKDGIQVTLYGFTNSNSFNDMHIVLSGDDVTGLEEKVAEKISEQAKWIKAVFSGEE